ncbi:hypothetical protein [Haloparvum sp. AD34]
MLYKRNSDWVLMSRIRDHLEADEVLDVQTAGFTKCRFPVLAKRYVVRDGEVLHADLSSPTRSTSSVVLLLKGSEVTHYNQHLVR